MINMLKSISVKFIERGMNIFIWCLLSVMICMPAFSDVLDNWPLWPSSPYLNLAFQKYTRPYPPLSFTIVGQDRDFLSWVITVENPEPDDTYDASWGSVLYLSNLAETNDVVSSDTDNPFYQGDTTAMPETGPGSEFLSLQPSDLEALILPSHVDSWAHATFTGSPASGDIANQYVPSSWLDSWRDEFALAQAKGPGGNYFIADSGHSSPVLNWVDNYWVDTIEGFSQFENYLNQAYQDEYWGDAILYLATNEGWVHAISTNESYYFEEKWSVMPLPALQLSPYHYYYRQENGSYYPRLTLMDGFLNIGDIEVSPGVWRRVLLGTTGMGSSLKAKADAATSNDDIWDLEVHSISSDITAVNEISGDQPVITDGHTFGLYAITVAESADVTPNDPELLWSISNAYWRENGVAKGKIFIDGVPYSRSDLVYSNDYGGYLDLKMSLSRPVTGFVEDSSGNRLWREILVGIDSSDHFSIYNIDANTGRLVQDPIELCQALDYYSGSNIAYWDTDYEAGFPTRVGAIAHNENDVPGGGATLDLQTKAVMNEIYIHLSNGNLYVWSPQEDMDNGVAAEGPKLLMKMYYQMSLKKTLGGDYSKAQLGAASMQDFDATYMRTSVNNEGNLQTYHRCLALVIKDGEGEYDADTDTETKDDIRLLLLLDITNILKYAEDHPDQPIILDPASLGRGNQTVILPLTTDYSGGDYRYGWQMYLAGADPATDKYWNQDIAISSPIFYNGRLVLASYEPDNNQSHIYVLPITKEDIDYLASKPVDPDNPTGDTYLKQAADSYALQEGATIITFEGIEFTGGAAIDEEGNVYVGTADGSMIRQDISALLPPLPGSGSAYVGSGDILYWKVIE